MPVDDRPLTRAEARRRARLAARGELPDPEEAEAEPALQPPRRSGGLLQRLFPPAPPLPGRPNPLAGYTGGGLPRAIGERMYLLRRNPLAWVPTGIVAVVGYNASLSYGGDVLGLVGTFMMFGALIAAGWFGWLRPTLFGTAAGVVAFVLGMTFVIVIFAMRGAGPDTFTFEESVLQIVIQGLYLVGLGLLGGWYGGYLRRRQAQVSAQERARPRRR